MRRVSIFLTAVLAFTGVVCAAEQTSLKLPAVFGDHMVLQRNVPAPVWGWAAPGEKVVVSFLNQTKEATAGADGKWMVKLDSLTAGGPYTLTISGKTSLTLKDVLVGEVWLASGQSNMEFALRGAIGGEAAAKASANPNIHLFNVSLKKKPATTPQSDLEAAWTPCEEAEAIKFSAVAYYFGRELQKDLNMPVGLIHSSWGGTPIEYWLNEKTLKADADMAVAYANHEKAVANYPAAQKR